MFFALCLWGTQSNAQNVTIGPDNGSLVVGQAGAQADDSGITRGLYAMWRHEQLSLTMTTSDLANLTSAGELQDPSCAIGKYNGKLILAAGQTQTFVVVSLPKGYRITGYRLVLQPDLLMQNVRGPHATRDFTLYHSYGTTANNSNTKGEMAFYETPAWSTGTPYGQNTHSEELVCEDRITVAKAADGDSVMSPVDDASKEFVIQRTSQTPDDMGNQLHFFFARSCSQYGVSVNSFEIFFTAEGTFDADVTPASASLTATDYVTSPFTTSKMDVGAIALNQNGIYTYDYTGVHDLVAYTHLYQDNAYSDGIPAHQSDGPQNISSIDIDGKGVFAFGNDTYFIEPPTTIHTASGWESPIGFRVVGAKFDYKWYSEEQGFDGESISIPNAIRIVGGNGYYLDDQLIFVQTNQNNAFIWLEDEYGNLYIEYEDASQQKYRKYLACFGEGNERMLSLSSAATGNEAKWNLRLASNNRICYYSDGGNTYTLNYRGVQEGSPTHRRGYVTKDYNGNSYATYTTSGNHQVQLPGFNPGNYTLEIFGTSKTTPVKTVTVNSAASADTYELTGLNNDAVMFRISGLPEGKQAVVNVTLELEALNPYINSMDITCHDTPDIFQLTQTFTANDFKVSGGKFVFYIPEEYKEEDLTITFDKLYSNYGDATYYTGTPEQKDGNARYSFVTSDYFMSNPDLYDTDPDASYTTKISTSTAGNIRFKFNNAEDLATGTEASYLQEYQFDYDDYIGSDDPDGSEKVGNYISCKLNASELNNLKKDGTFFVFTADETRYNIAPTVNWEHRAYAFYRMDIILEAKTYEPILEWTKVYDKTCYYSGEEDFPDNDLETPNAKVSTEPMFGVKVITEKINGQMGYLTYHSIDEAIKTATQSGDNINAPKNKNQILYIDCSELHALQTSDITTEGSKVAYDMSKLKTGLADNALVFMPKNSTSTLDNVAFLQSGAFYAGKDIVLTDRMPFYSPYDIQVDAANKAIYTREITLSDYGKDALATVMLPFTLSVTNGLHTNADNSSISIWEMGSSDMTLKMKDLNHDYGVSYFKEVSGSSTSANVPYMVKVEAAPSGTNSFIAAQTGGKIFATTTTTMKSRTVGTSGYNGGTYQYLYTGTSATGTVDGGSSVSLNPEGSYSGQIYDRAESEAIFFFGNNKFLNLYKLVATKQFLYMYPFRGVYTFDGSVAGVNTINGLEISFDDPGNLDAIRDINLTKANVPDLAVRSGKGFIEITSTKDQTVNVLSLNGTSYSRVIMNAGDSKTVNLPAGVYVVNNVKIIVK